MIGPLILLAVLAGLARAGPGCPALEAMPGCPCYEVSEGLSLECAGSTEESLRSVLLKVIAEARPEGAVIQSLSVYELDRRLDELRGSAFPAGVQIRHLQIAQSALREIAEGAFDQLAQSLESLALTSSRLTVVPQKALAGLGRLGALDLSTNQIHDLPSYAFSGMPLTRLVLKANQIAKVAENAFVGLEGKLKELDLTENTIRVFPMTALRKLDELISLQLAWNEISRLPEDGNSRLEKLNALDLSSNNFVRIPVNCFRCCPALKNLALYYNSVEDVDKDAFISLNELESIDLSHNKIVYLDVATFRANQRLRIIDLSHNHIHYIWGVFSKLPDLREVYLVDNNILEIAAEAFAGSVNLRVLHLQQNAIRRIDSKGLVTLSLLSELHLTGNFIERIPRDFFEHSVNLSTLSLDGNAIRELEVGTFAKAKHLRELRLQDNQITEVKRGVFAPLPALLELHLQNNIIIDMETGALSSLRSLQHVNLQGNLLAVLGDVFQVSNDIVGEAGSSQLVSIQLDSNGLGVLHNDSLRGQSSVRMLWLGHNRLTRLQAPLFRDLLLVEKLYLTNNSISRIEDTAFQPMQALKFLDLSVNKLTHVTVKMFSELQELEELYLSDNELRHLDAYSLTALKRLRILDLSNNQLKSLQETMFQEGLPIRILNLRNCSIDTIDRGTFRGLNNLYELNLEFNLIKANLLDRLEIPGLRVLKISRNNFSQISSRSLGGLPSLQHLGLESAQIEHLPPTLFFANKNLAKLHLNGNRLSSIPFDLLFGLESLKELRLDANRFSDVPHEAFMNTSSLEILSFAGNLIWHVDVSKLQGLSNLRELVLRDNQIKSVTGFEFISLTRLMTLDLADNHLGELPNNFFTYSSALRKIDLSANQFRAVPEVGLSGANVPSLAWLNISGNPITKLHDISHSVQFDSLQEIHLCRTSLSTIGSQDFEAFPELLHLFLGQNLIGRLLPGAFYNLNKLQTLDLSANHLEVLPQERLGRLEHLRLLNLTRNRLSKLDDFAPSLKELQVLDLSNNALRILDDGVFQHLESLLELQLAGNNISAVAPNAFRSLRKLRVLDLSRNSLKSLPIEALKHLETQLRTLVAAENPLHCGCESQELWEWLRDHRKLVGGRAGGGLIASGSTGSASVPGGVVGAGGGLARHRSSSSSGANDSAPGSASSVGGLLRCDRPAELKGHVFLELDSSKLCSPPAIHLLAVQDVQPYSVLVSWQRGPNARVQGYRLVFYLLDDARREILTKEVGSSVRSIRLTNLLANARYRICIVAIPTVHRDRRKSHFLGPRHQTSQYSAEEEFDPELQHQNSGPEGLLRLLNDTRLTRCTEAMTLALPDAVASSDGSQMLPGSAIGGIGIGGSLGHEEAEASSILTRRLGLTIGFCLGFVVFAGVISVLGYLKLKKQREAAKRDRQPAPPEFLSYRHFSIQSAEGRTAIAGHHLDQQPVIITTVNSLEHATFPGGGPNNSV